MAITQAVCNSFKKELLEGDHEFQYSGGDTFKLALYISTATLSAATTGYATSGEVGNSGQYTAGGGTLVKPNPSTSVASGVAIVDFNDLSFTGVSITARGALIYNNTMGGGSNTTDAVCVLDFGADKTATSGTFTIQFPSFTTAAAILRIGNA
tara:strand:- start:596 stop:1054 length:459 start_codon:yes stop_codon:yes gene_type:complete